MTPPRSYRGGMGAFAEMFPGRKPELKARDEEADGQEYLPRIPDGPIDLDSGVLRLEPPRRPAKPAESAEPPPEGG